VTYTTFFILAFLGYEKSTRKNPAANLHALLGVCLSDSFQDGFKCCLWLEFELFILVLLLLFSCVLLQDL
jgi:hypothetical protein